LEVYVFHYPDQREIRYQILPAVSQTMLYALVAQNCRWRWWNFTTTKAGCIDIPGL
jgi:hypothetical protein